MPVKRPKKVVIWPVITQDKVQVSAFQAPNSSSAGQEAQRQEIKQLTSRWINQMPTLIHKINSILLKAGSSDTNCIRQTLNQRQLQTWIRQTSAQNPMKESACSAPWSALPLTIWTLKTKNLNWRTVAWFKTFSKQMAEGQNRKFWFYSSEIPIRNFKNFAIISI